ncbi:MAG: Tetratricopeptide 2 repeat protein [Deltaproteobacteria bacterium]|nr:Tetratricopeptide 2 repeat protein [Deltaproteobacteria bacterium]
MPEHTIPESLIEQIRTGKAALVVGAGIGVPSWKQMLERLTKALETRGREGDTEATKDLEKLLHKGNLVRAVGFLARSLGEDTCDKIVEEVWAAPAETPALPAALATLPFRHVWTTFPGDVLEHAFETKSPDEWPPTRVVTYQELGELSPRRRTLVKMFGNFDTYIVTPRSVRRALSRAVDLRDYARKLYVEGALVFVGFRYGDPDLAALLDRVFGMFEPPRGTHYFLGAGVGPVTVDELMADHHIEVVNLQGRGGDEVAERSVIEWLDTLRDTCAAAGVTLLQARPDADDTEGWIAMLGDTVEEAAEARDALDLIERRARDAKDWDTVIEVLLGRIEHAGDGLNRAMLLRQLAEVYEVGRGDLRRAFEAVTTACQVAPEDNESAQLAERLAAATGGWADLVSEASEIATDATDPKIASLWWARLGGWYSTKLDRPDYATPSLRRALELDGTNTMAFAALAETQRKQSKWAELADTLRAHAEVETNTHTKVDLLLGLGDLCESQLASTAKAIEAYQAAADLDDTSDDALAALERLYRRDERWANLAKVLDRRAEIYEESGDTGRAAALRRELATMRAEKLGDLEGAIARYEAAVSANGSDATALKALVDLYDKTGRTDDYINTMERLGQVAPEAEKLSTLRKLAAELEDRDPARAALAYERLLAADPMADDAYRGLERVLEIQENWPELVALQRRHLAAAKTPAQRVELNLSSARIHDKRLDDPNKAIEALLNVLAIEDQHREALANLPALYLRTKTYDRAVDILVRHAAIELDGAWLYAEAGRIAAEHLNDLELAQRHYDKALSNNGEHLATLKGLGALHAKRANWGQAVELMLRAEGTSGNRLERVELLWAAAQLVEQKLEDRARSLEIYERVLKLDPDHVEAGQRVADQLVAAKRWDDALPVLEMLARQAEGLDRLERSRREAQLGHAYEALHRTEKAARHYRLAVEQDPDSFEAAIGLAAVLMTEAKANEGNEVANEQWREVDRRYREILARHRTGIADGRVAEIWYRLGIAARALGEDKKAEASFRRALEKDPLHEPTLGAMVELGGARGEWKMVTDAKRAQVAALAKTPGPEIDERRAKLFEEIGDILRERLKDVVNATGAYSEGLVLSPSSRVLLHKLLESYTEQRQWRRAIETLDALSAQETSPDRRARFHYTAAVIARDELKDSELAVDRFHAALDDAPLTPKAFEGVEKLLSDRKDWKNLARAFRRQLKRMGEDAPVDVLLALWTKLGDTCLDHLGDQEAATEAYQVACELAPDDIQRHEQLADLYLEAGEARRHEAIAELQFLLGHAPDRVELYKALALLYRAEHELDKAWCVAQALVFLGAASDEETLLYQRFRPAQFQPAPRRLTEELWQKSIIHPREDRHVGAIFSSTLGAVAAGTAQPVTAFGLTPETRADLDRDPRAVSRVVKYVSGVLAIDPTPMVWLQETGDGLRVANTVGLGAERQRLVPTLLVGAQLIGKTDERELAFEVGKRMAYLRPERFVTLALGTLPKLEAAFSASLIAGGARLVAHDGQPYGDVVTDEAKKMATSLRQQVPGPLLEQVGELSIKLSGRVGNGLIAAWRTATDLTANRVGFIVSNDLETAAKAIATEGAALSSLSVKDRLRDLLSYAVSESYFAVRRHLGLHVREEVSA